MKKHLAIAGLLAFSACATVSTAIADVQNACSIALKAGSDAAAVAKGGAANTVASINQYVGAGCQTADTVAVLAADASSVDWLNQNAATLNTIATTAAVAPAATSP